MKAVTEKAPKSIKKVVKVISEPATKLYTFTVDIKIQVAKIGDSNADIKVHVGKLCESVEYTNTTFEEFKKYIHKRKELQR